MVSIKQDVSRWRSGVMEEMSQHERIVDMLPEDPDHILMALDFEMDAMPAVYKVNVMTGKRAQVKGGRRGVQDWYTDGHSQVRLGKGHEARGSEFRVMYKQADDAWIDLQKLDWAKYLEILSLAPEPDTLYVVGASDHGTSGLFKLNVLSGEVTQRVFAHEKFDFTAILNHPLTDRLIGVAYMDAFPRVHYVDPDLELIQRSIDRVMPGTVNRIVSMDRHSQRYFILSESDVNPGDYYLYDRPKRHLTFVAKRMARIDPKQMSHTREVGIPMRDGTVIPAFLTLPKNRETDNNLPAVIMPHGGPAARDSARWDYAAQFLANRGYVVLKPNFRGSSGYGAAFEQAGNKQWGGLMQDDVTDATHWLIKEGIADPKRVCISGASYGGYAALMGVIKEPGLYACAISINGVTNLPKLKAHDRHFVGGLSWNQDVGLEGAEDEAISPYHRAKEIGVPILLISSKDDARIPYRFSQDLHKRLKRLKKDSHYVKIENGGHWMLTMESRLTALKASEQFLAKHIGR